MNFGGETKPAQFKMNIRLYKLLDDARAIGQNVLFEEKEKTTIATVEHGGKIISTYRRVNPDCLAGLLTEWELQP